VRPGVRLGAAVLERGALIAEGLELRALFDIVHPAHVHFYRNLHARLTAGGHECRVLARDREMTLALLDAYGISYEVHGSPQRGHFRQGAELARRDLRLVKIGRRFKPDVVLARNPAGMHAARVLGTVGIFDTDDGSAGGSVFRLAAPFASVITTPSCLTEDFGPKHVSYPGYKALAFLHPDHYVPDPAIRDELGVGSDPYAIVRLTAMEAAHDHKEQGVPTPAVDKVIEVLAARGRVFLSCEGEIPPGYERLAFSVPPQRMHDAMAFATVVIGDSGSMVGEAAVLGTPAVFCGSFAHRREYLPDLERRWGLVATYLPEEAEQFVETVTEIVGDAESRAIWQERRVRMLEQAVDVSAWYDDLLTSVTTSGLASTLACGSRRGPDS
jgi:uncharacterized protein